MTTAGPPVPPSRWIAHTIATHMPPSSQIGKIHQWSIAR